MLLFLFYSTLHIGQKAGNTLLTGCSACYSSIVGECYVLVVRWQFVSIVMLLIRLKLLQSWASILASQRKTPDTQSQLLFTSKQRTRRGEMCLLIPVRLLITLRNTKILILAMHVIYCSETIMFGTVCLTFCTLC